MTAARKPAVQRWGQIRAKWLPALARTLLKAPALALVLLVFQGVTASHAFTEQEIREAFRLFDSNSDGRISREEFELNKVSVLFRRNLGDVQRPDRPIQLRYEDLKISRTLFDELDQNGDGILTGAEIIGSPALQFEALDTNHDGFVEYSELADFMHRIGR